MKTDSPIEQGATRSRSTKAKLTIAALTGLLAGGTLIACNSGSQPASKDSTPASKSANACSGKDGCPGKDGCGAKSDSKKNDSAKASCSGKDGCPGKDETKQAAGEKNSCGGKNGCG
ncbi:MAG: hypothetical protein JRI23_04235 [Deltaproteobacteria bacterium]|nr:hypothetical protein [Deltaproteobacteria bacterium]MBW2530743.1 hypothetical protein [Deltaproteobacteria bacterium]